MMYGLYGSTKSDEEYTLSECIVLRPDTMRIYPVVVLSGTHLGELYESGKYILPSWEDMISFTAGAICRLKQEGIALIRCGLHAEKGMEDRIISGFYHPSLKEMALGKLYLSKMLSWAENYSDILKNREKGDYVLLKRLKAKQVLRQDITRKIKNDFSRLLLEQELRSLKEVIFPMKCCEYPFAKVQTVL